MVVWLGAGCGDNRSSHAQPVARQSTVGGAIAGLPPVAAAIALGTVPLAIDERGIPRLLRAATTPLLPAPTATEVARAHVERLLPAWGARLAPDLVANGEVAVPGGTIVKFRQQLQGMPIEARELRVFVRADGGLVAIGGSLIAGDAARTAVQFRDTDAQAVAAAVRETFKAPFDANALHLQPRRSDGKTLFSGDAGGIHVSLASAHRVWFATADRLIAAWSTETYAGDKTSSDGAAFHTVLAASDGKVLAQRDLRDDVAFNYRVFAETAGEYHPFDGPLADYSPNPLGVPSAAYPPFVAPNIVSVQGLNTLNDPWLAAGKTETQGNNAEAYTDFTAPDGFTLGDFRATTTSANTFDRTYDLNAAPLTQPQQMAAITSLFYTVNWLHDFWYDHGFTETAGNAQDNNYGRGGQDRDAMLAEAEDNALGGSRNNANMSTPEDGLPPRLQVYVWSGAANASLTAGAFTPGVGTAAFGPNTFDVTADVVLANDGNGVASDACQALTNGAGQIVIVDRGTCSFKTKTLNAQNAGAVGVILANNAASATPPNLGDDATITTPITIGTLSLTQADGVTLKASVAAGTVTATLHRLTGVDRDGDLDAGVLAHEFGHYLHHRLSACGTALCGAMSEGWGDFDALLFTVRDGDNYDGAYPFGIYSTISFSNAPAYFGIRRMPYSTNMAINALSFRHMTLGEALPTTVPIVTLGANNEAHNAGEIWAETLFEAYIALQHAGTSWSDVRTKMADYVVAGLLLAPTDVTPTEMRDALLTAAFANDPADFATMAAAFARRGMGSCAVSPARDSTDFSGIVESTDLSGRIQPGAAHLTDAVTSCDHDGILDSGEVAHLTIPVTNAGHAALTNVTVTVASTTPGINVTGAATNIGSLAVGAMTEVTANVALADGIADPVAADFTITMTADNACDPITLDVPQRMNVDDVAQASSTDTFDAGTSVWAATSTVNAGWSAIRETALDGAWHGTDLGSVSDSSLTSPPLIAGTGNVTLAFTHSFDFESTFDGGVIEYSIDNGATWADITTLGVTPGYGGALDTTSGGPLAGRPAFTGTNPSSPATDAVTLDFGTQLASQTFRLRFRIGTDQAQGGGGWTIDDVILTGLTNKPFPAQVADQGSCATPQPDAGMVDPGVDAGHTTDGGAVTDPVDGGCCSATPLHGTSILMSLGVLGLVLRRRRR